MANINNHRVIYASMYFNYNEEEIAELCRDIALDNDMEPDEVTDETIWEMYEQYLDDERCNLNIETGGYIIGLASLGLWNGRRTGAKIIGGNVRDILNSFYSCDEGEFFADRYNVRFNGYHHDGRNSMLFRYVDTYEQAERIVEKIVSGVIDSEEKFRKATKSIRKFVANVYGW